MAIYESVIIFSPKVESEKEEKIISDLTAIYKKEKVKILHQASWGKRPLAYLIRKEKEGIYHYFAWESESGNVVQKLEQKIKVTDTILRSFHVRIDEDLKRLKKNYRSGKNINICGEIKNDGAKKDKIEDLDLINLEPTTVYLRNEY